MVIIGDCKEVLKALAADGVNVQTCITSPPYYALRDYGHKGQIGQEATSEEYINALVGVFLLVWNVLADDGTCWVNLGDTYAGSGNGAGPGWGGKQGYLKTNGVHSAQVSIKEQFIKAKDLYCIPWRFALAMRGAGWYLRSDIIWEKPNVLPEPVKDRPTRCHEYMFLFSKKPNYYYDYEAIKEPCTMKPENRKDDYLSGEKREHSLKNKMNVMNKRQLHLTTRNKRTVWSVNTKPLMEGHFAAFPEKLIEPCVLAGSRVGDTVLDPFGGSGTTGVVSKRLGRKHILIEINPEYEKIINKRTTVTGALPLDV